MRATSHSGRYHKGTGQIFNAAHNDRTATNDMPNVVNNLSKNNAYMTWNGCKTFAEAEKQYYQENFSTALEQQNERYRKSRQYKRVKTIDDLVKGKLTCPDERLISVGNADCSIDKDKLNHIIVEHIRWHRKRFPQIQILDIASHCDEKDPSTGIVTAPHAHMRTIAYAIDENGNKSPQQDKAFEQMGVELPFPDKKKGRYNNRKMMYSAECRLNIIEICAKMGIKVELEPRDASRSGMDLIAHKRMKEEERLRNIRNELAIAKEEIKALHDLTDEQIEEILQPIESARETLKPH